MADIIERWLKDCLGLAVSMEPAKFAYFVMDGWVIAKLLHRYNIITEDQFISIFRTDNKMIAFRNLQHISHWLKAADIYCSNEYLLDISTGKSTLAIKLFYQLYLALHDKDKFDYIVNWKSKQKLRLPHQKFIVSHVPEEILDQSIVPDNILSKQLIDHAGEINWNKDRYQHIVEQYEETRARYARYIREKFGVQYRKKFCITDEEEPGKNQPDLGIQVCLSETHQISEEDSVCESEQFTYEQLVLQEVKAKSKPAFVPDPKEVKKIINILKQKHREERNEKESMLYQQRMLLINMWSDALARQENDFEQSISKTLLKQSEYEKQMLTKMLEVRQQKQHILENRRLVDEEIMRKRDEEFLQKVFLREKDVSDQKYKYYFEKERILELHKRLYNKKMQLKFERHYNMCMDAVKDIVNVSLKHVEYKRTYAEEAPERVVYEWKNLFVKQQSIFDLLRDVDDIVGDTSDLPPEVEEIFCLEIKRQNQLDEREFADYLKLEYPWLPKDLLNGKCDLELTLTAIELANNILGHNVHRVLLSKYPKPKPPLPPDIPKATVAACVNGLRDTTTLPVLQKLLNNKGVRVIELEEAINHCIKVYQNEIETEYIDNVLKEETSAVLETNTGIKNVKNEPPKKNSKIKDTKNKPPDDSDSVLEPQTGFVEKQSQTPKIYPCEEVVLSSAGELGKTAYENLNLGEQLTDKLLVAMFVELLKTLRDIKGWVLMNYPTTFEQAALLEEAITGVPIPPFLHLNGVDESGLAGIEDIADLAYRNSQWVSEDANKILQTSKILPNPTSPLKEAYYDTYLTAFIDVKQGCADEYQNDKATQIAQFYSEQGCNYAFYYNTLDLAAIKHLAKLIIGEYTIPPKKSLELFGDTVLYMEATDGATLVKGSKSEKIGEKKEKRVIQEKSTANLEEKIGKKDEKRNNGNISKGKSIGEIVAVAKVDKETQIPEQKFTTAEVFCESPPEARAGEPFWNYPVCAIPEFIENALATFWENTEKVYTVDFKQTFFVKRVIMNAFMPYLNHVKNYVDTFIARPDDKQVYLHEFQRLYNEIEMDMRDDDELKAEIHCRIAEFREKLWEICDKRMRDSEALRRHIIADNWVTKQLNELTNNYICEMQLECDRCCSSLQFLTDYYSGIITKMPSSEPVLETVIFTKGFSELCGSKTSVISREVGDEIEKILTARDAESFSTKFHEMIESILATCTVTIDRWNLSSLNVRNKMNNYFTPVGKKGTSKPEKGGSKKDKSAKLPKINEPELDVKEAGPKIMEEWETAISGEYQRVKFRLSLLIAKAFFDIENSLDAAKKIFYYLFDAIKDRYHREMESVETACDILAKAVEAEIPLQPQLVFDGDKFYITPDVLMFPEELPPADPPVTEPRTSLIFTIEQLTALTDVLMDLAPNASIIERAFIFLLQDMIVHNSEDGQGPLVPRSWQKLQPQHVSQLSKELFGNSEYIDWKDFIINSLCLSYPNEQQLLQVREAFRVNDPDLTETNKNYQFFEIKFWFEENFDINNPREFLRLKLIKELLFKLFCTDNDTVNYTALLLAFCKDKEMIKGLAKALALSFGKCACWDISEGAHYVDSILSQRQIEDEMKIYQELSHLETQQECKSILDSVIDETVHMCDSLILEDYVSGDGNYVQKEKTKQDLSTTDIEFLHFTDDFKGSEDLNENCIGVEVVSETSYYQPKVYYLPFESILNVLTAALPWHIRQQTIQDDSFRNKLASIYDNLKDPEFNNNVLTHQLLNDVDFNTLLLHVTKFKAIYPSEIVSEILENYKVA